MWQMSALHDKIYVPFLKLGVALAPTWRSISICHQECLEYVSQRACAVLVPSSARVAPGRESEDLSTHPLDHEPQVEAHPRPSRSVSLARSLKAKGIDHGVNGVCSPVNFSGSLRTLMMQVVPEVRRHRRTTKSAACSCERFLEVGGIARGVALHGSQV
jgi:hypothetical protein